VRINNILTSAPAPTPMPVVVPKLENDQNPNSSCDSPQDRGQVRCRDCENDGRYVRNIRTGAPAPTPMPVVVLLHEGVIPRALH
jgi:hypothetical protein